MSLKPSLLHVIGFFYLSILVLNAEELISSNLRSCYIEQAPECSFKGDYNCGTCDCYPNYFGRQCECVVNEKYAQLHPCQAPDSSVVCSGRGVCICNQCECDMRENANEVITGQWCECDNYTCARNGGEICGGHGVCECGRCACSPPWTGESCECYSAVNTCYPPTEDNPKLCDGHGDCVCGICHCFKTPEETYSGSYCQQCSNCTGPTN